MSSVIQRLARIAMARFAAAGSRDAGGAPAPDAANTAGTGRGGAAASVDAELAGYYANLELPDGADLQAVRQARKQLMRKYHPDLHGSDPERQRVATELVKGLNRAYEGLRRHLENGS